MESQSLNYAAGSSIPSLINSQLGVETKADQTKKMAEEERRLLTLLF